MIKSNRRRILVFIDYDNIIRHFIKSGILQALQNRYDVLFAFARDPVSTKQTVSIDPAELGLQSWCWVDIPRKRLGYWFFLYAITVLRQQRGLSNFSARRRQFVQQNGERRVRILEALGLPGLYQIVRAVFLKIMGVWPKVRELVMHEQPDLIIYPSLLTGPFMNELLPLVRKVHIPLVVLMNSWDNPSAKAVCTGVPDWLVVWGEQSKQQAIEYMRIPAERILIFGAAQFQVYRQPPAESEMDLRKMFAVPADKRILLYAGAGSGAHETIYLKLLEQAVESGILENCHVLYRPHPWRGALGPGEEDFFAVKWNHVSMDPHMADYYRREISNPSGRIFMADYRVTNKLLTLAAGVISPLSTMLIESLVKGKPVVVFFPEREHNVHFGVDEVHFREFIELPDVNVCLAEADFLEKCSALNRQLGDPELAVRLKAAAQYFVDMMEPTYSERLEQLVEEVAIER